jgi:hypothetical protein
MQGKVIKNTILIEYKKVSLTAAILFSDACLEREGNITVAAAIAKIHNGN